MEDTATKASAETAQVIPLTDSHTQDQLPWTLQQTLTMLRRGHHPTDIAKMRNRSQGTIINHMMTLAARDKDFDLAAHVDEQLMEELREKAGDWKPGDALAPVVESLDKEHDTTALKIHLVQLIQE